MNPWAAQILAGDARALARAATGVENRDPHALEVLGELAPYAGQARIVGITGPPGVGKSTLVDALTGAIRSQGKTVAVVAVDPSSRLTGGAILGDRIRMQQRHSDPGVFIRSMATRGRTGGLARATEDVVRLMDASGKDYVVVETVGVGQDEVDISGLAHVTALVLVPGMGDDVQAIKAGIMEIAGVFVVNKADLPGADRVERELRAALALTGGNGVPTPIVRTVATDGVGIDELLKVLDEAAERTKGAVPNRDREKAAALPRIAIEHVGIAVNSLDEALLFYESLGLALAGRETIAAEKVNVAILAAGESTIELLEPSGPDSPVAKFLAKRGPGVHHMALRVADLDAAVKALIGRGARLLGESRAGAGGHSYVFVHPSSAGGVLLELIEEKDI